MSKAKLYLIPNLLGSEANLQRSIPAYNLEAMEGLRHFAVEHIKDARRFLVKCGLKSLIDQSEFIEVNKRSDSQSIAAIGNWLKQGHDVGMISDAGCPGIADPGAELANWAHHNKFQVVPLIGPSSILLALIASGLNGQSFTFHGYLERDKGKLNAQLKELELSSKKYKRTEIFMETPYRNEALFEQLLKTLNPQTRLCVAADISLPTEFIRTNTIQDWKKLKVNLHKKPAIFLLLS